MEVMDYHNAVLLEQTVAGLAIKPDGVYVDVTFGGGGHSREILKYLGPNGKLFAFDQDEDAWENRIDDERFMLVPHNFRHLKRFLRFHGITEVDGILADLGVSSHQFDVAERGFSTRFDAPLDMRMSKSNSKSAYTVINEYEEKALKHILLEYGELKSAPAMARTIVHHRNPNPIATTERLKEVLRPFYPAHKSHKILAQVYQAIRIEVNEEIDVLREMLEQAVDVLKPGGRLSVISYHSLEDRLVKRLIKNGQFEGEPERDFFGNFQVPLKAIGKLIVPDQAELEANSRSRSAKLRIAEKVQIAKK